MAKHIPFSSVLQGMTLEEFIDTFGVLEDATEREMVPFKLWAGQRMMVRWLNGRREGWIPKARQLGISEIGASRSAKDAVSRPRSQHVIISKTQPDAEYFLEYRVRPKLEALSEYAGGTLPFPHIVGKHNKSEIVLSNGSTITSLPASNASGASRTLNSILYDEAGGIDKQNNCSFAELYKNGMPTIEKDKKAWAMIIGTSEPGTFFNRHLWRQFNGEVDKKYYFLNWQTDPNRDEAWARKQRGEYDTEADFMNQYPRNMSEFFASREGRVFAAFDMLEGGSHVKEFQTPHDGKYIYAYDHGFKHFACRIHCIYLPYTDMLLVFDEEYWKGWEVSRIAKSMTEKDSEIRRVPSKRLADIQIFNVDGRISPANIFKQYGINLDRAWKHDEAGSRGLLADRFAKNKVLIHPRCVNLRQQLSGYVWKKSETGKEKPQDKDDDGIDCLRWICAHIDKEHPPMAKNRPQGRVAYAKVEELSNVRRRNWQSL